MSLKRDLGRVGQERGFLSAGQDSVSHCQSQNSISQHIKTMETISVIIIILPLLSNLDREPSKSVSSSKA